MYGNIPICILVEVYILTVVLCCSVPVIRRTVVKLMSVLCYQLVLLGNN
jgi:hypothetical protein